MKETSREVVLNFVLLALCSLALIYIFGCTQPAVKPAPQVEGYTALWDKQPNGKELTNITVKALETYGTGLVALDKVSDAQTYCPGYSKLTPEQRKAFYVYFISAIAWRESDFNSSEQYQEGFNDAQGRPVISRGLLQISQESANQRAYGCGISRPEDLSQDGTNLSCGVRILNYWIPRDGNLGTNKTGGARYWAVLRESSKARTAIIEKLKQLTFCQ